MMPTSTPNRSHRHSLIVLILGLGALVLALAWPKLADVTSPASSADTRNTVHGVDASAALLRLRLEHRARRARLLQLQLRGARRLSRAYRQLHPARPAVQVYTAIHPFDAEQRRHEEFGKPVEAAADLWAGGGAIILPGV